MRQRREGSGLPTSGRGIPWALIVSVAAVFAWPHPAIAQIMIASPADGSSPDAAKQGFTVPTDEAMQNSFGDFERHVERKAWEKAFATLTEIPAEKRKGMLARADGVIIPASQRIWDAIAALPAEGRDAFRLFNEAKGKQTWTTATDPQTPWSDQVTTAEKVYQEFFLTSVGDNAADFLGDVAFERGDYETAERYWRNVLEKHPDSDVSEARLLFKRGIALAQMRQTASVATVIRSLEQRFPGQKMKVGGNDVDPTTYLNSRLRSTDNGISSVTQSLEAGIVGAPVPETQRVWRTQFLSDKAVAQRESSMRGYWYYRNGMETLVPATATDGKRIYLNWFGIVFAMDVATGKLAWRSQKFGELTQHFSNLPHSSANLDGYRIIAKEGLVLAVLLPVERLNYYQEPTRLMCLEAETGKAKWKTIDGGHPLTNVGFIGTPLIEDKEILVLGHGRNEAKLSLYCLDFDGKQKWVAELGTVRKTSTSSGYEKMPQPALLKRGRTLYIATEDGALAAFDMLDRKIRWLLPYATADKSTGGRRIFYSGQTNERTQLHTETNLLEHDGLIYVKEAGGRELLAVDPSAPSILWRRPAEESSQLVGVDDDSVYLLDTELSCINRKDRTLRWAARLPISQGGLSMVPGKDSILVLTGRGLFEIDRAKGKVKGIFRGADLAAGGGKLALVGDKLIAVTTQSITSYLAPVPATTVPSDSKGASP